MHCWRGAIGVGLTALFLCVAMVPVPEAVGGRFSINPTLVSFGPEATSVLLSVTNESQGEMRFQLSVFAWDQAPGGEMRLGPTEDVVFFPQILALGPGESRNIRLASLVAPDTSERSYRLFVEELPASQAERRPGVVQMLARVGVPIFVAPRGKVERAEITDLSRASNALSFTLANTGSVHFVPEHVSLKALAHDGTVLSERTLSAWYILAGGIRRFTSDLPGLSTGKAAEVLVEARVGQTRVSRRLDLATKVSR
ncbi:MAG: fimbria/pilus periplasmic chaperone [Acidobacteria bacterium]|nr:fimbria/pilus periplasmic chaperone [Acidobacteriota bacterium]